MLWRTAAALTMFGAALAACPEQRLYIKSADGSGLLYMYDGGPTQLVYPGSSIYGLAAPGTTFNPACSTISVYLQGATTHALAASYSTGDPLTNSTAWVATLPTAAGGLTNGAWTLTAQSSDPTGLNTPSTTTHSLDVETYPCSAVIDTSTVTTGRVFGNPTNVGGTTTMDCKNIQLIATSLADNSVTTYNTVLTTTEAASVFFSFQWPPASLAEGKYTLSVQSFPDAGTGRAASTPQTPIPVVINRAPCPGVVLTSPAPGSTVTSREPTLSGTQNAGAVSCPQLQVVIDGVNGVYAYAGSDGSYSFNVAPPLSDGLHNIQIISSDVHGQWAPSTTSFQLNVVGKACSPPVITSPANNPYNYAGSSVTIAGNVAENYCGYVSINIPSLNQVINTVINEDVGTDRDPYAPSLGWTAALSNLAPGTYNVAVTAAADTLGKWASSSTPLAIVIASGGCGVPTILSPVAGTSLETGSVVIKGQASSAACGTVYTYVDGQKFGPETLDADLQFTRILSPESDAVEYTVYITNEGSGNPPVQSISETFSYSPTNKACGPATLTSPAPGAVVSGLSFTYTGTMDPDPNCNSVVLRTNDPSQYVYAGAATISADGASFSGTYTAQKDGYYTFYLYRVPVSDYTIADYTGPTFGVTLYSDPCPAPVLTSPANGVTYNGAILFAGTVDSRPECGAIEILVNGHVVYNSVTGSQPYRHKRGPVSFSYTLDTSSLPLGPASVSVASTGSSGGLPTIPLSLYIAPALPGSSASLLLIDAQDNAYRNRKCIDDVKTNIERCGACDGPDCTMLENVASVACEDSQCIVSTCREGFDLLDNVCVRASSTGVHETPLQSILDVGLGIFAHSS